MKSLPALIQKIEGEFWTARQRQMHSLHYVISYRGSFKPELPDYFIRQFTRTGQIVADPFCGRGTTILQANLLGRHSWASDINPLALAVTRAKSDPVSLAEISTFLQGINWQEEVNISADDELLAFYHPRTLAELRILQKKLAASTGATARFVELLALSRLHGHSNGFFSVYSMPQVALPVKAQLKINQRYNRHPEYRAVAPRILAKARAALRDNLLDEIRASSSVNLYATADARDLSAWPPGQVDLIVTSPPFLDNVDYLLSNWLELWFLNICPQSLQHSLVQTPSMSLWQDFMKDVLLEMARILRKGGICVLESGEITVCREKVNLDEVLAELVLHHKSRLKLRRIMIHKQNFSKLSHCFRVENNQKGTNTHRLLIMEKV